VDILVDNRMSRLYATMLKAVTSLGRTRQKWCCKVREGIQARLQKAPALFTRVSVALPMCMPAG